MYDLENIVNMTCPSFRYIWIISSILFLWVECDVLLDIPSAETDIAEGKFSCDLSNQSGSSSENNFTMSDQGIDKDCLKVVNVTDSTISIKSKRNLKLTLEKCTGFRTFTQKKIRTGMNSLQKLEACTTYRLIGGEKCSALAQTTYTVPEVVSTINASVNDGILTLTWFSDKATNCISHYQVNVLKDLNLTTEHKSRVNVQHYALNVTKCENIYFSVTTVDIRGQKHPSDYIEIAVRDKTAVIVDPTEDVSQYSHNLQECEILEDEFLNRNEVEADARDSIREPAKCDFSNRDYLWIGSQSVIISTNFSCSISKCMAQCCSIRKAGKCVENPYEYWFYNCSPMLGVGGIKILVTGDKLTRNVVYYCSIETLVANQNFIQESYFTTRDGRPAPPGNVWSTNVTSSSFMISWEASPHTEKDPVDYYILTVKLDQPSYSSAPSCWFPKERKIYNTTKAVPQVVDSLLPYFVHRVYVDAYNSYGYTRSAVETIITKPSDPGPCEDVSKTDLYGNCTDCDPVFIFNWSQPCRWNGQPRDTTIKITGRRPDNINVYFFHEEYFHSYRNSFRLNASRDFVYVVELFARVEKSVKPKLCSLPWTISIPPGLSSVTSRWSKIRPEVLTPDDGGTPLAAIPLHQNLLDDSNGTVKYVALMVAEKGQQGVKERNYLPAPNWPNTRNWNAAMTEDHVLLYQATPKYWYIPLFDDNIVHAYNLGSDTCDTNETSLVTRRQMRSSDESLYDWDYHGGVNTSNSEVEQVFYCNGPLRKNIEYIVRLRVFTAAGYSDSDEIYFRTGHMLEEDASFYNQSWFYAIFPIFLASALLTMIWIKKKRKGSNAIASAPSTDSLNSTNKSNRSCNRRQSISPQKLPSVAAHLLSQRGYLEREFEELNEISTEWASKVPCTIGLMKENRLKNRYADVVPYDYNRVKLSSESTSKTDYINASYIKGFSMDTEYIACQGPTAETSNDFWQMVFDQHVCFIVMLTSLVENGMAKCFQYFSELCENKEWMDFTVKCTSRLDLSNYTVRELQLYKKTSGEKRSIQHFQFRDWPDFRCPSDIDAILEFCDVLRGNLCLRGDSKTVVHCSAGIGRTGTLIALDILLQFVHYNRKLDILRTVRRLREQRQWMVRTVDQYAFLYRCLKTAAERHFSSVS